MKSPCLALVFLLFSVTTAWAQFSTSHASHPSNLSKHFSAPRLAAAADDIISEQPAGTLLDGFYRYGRSLAFGTSDIEEKNKDGIYGKIVEADDHQTFYLYSPLNAFSFTAWAKLTRTQGDTLEMKLPQHLAHDDDNNQEAYLYHLKQIETEDEDGTHLTFVPDENQTVKFLFRGDTLQFINPHPDTQVLGMTNEEGEWYGYSDYTNTWVKINEEPVCPQMPYDEQEAGAALVYDAEEVIMGRVVKMVKEDGYIYLQGLNKSQPESWAKGQIRGDSVVFKSKQYMGIDEESNAITYFQPLAHEYLETLNDNNEWVKTSTYVTCDSIVFSYDAEEMTLKTDSSFCVNQGYNQYCAVSTVYDGAELQPWTEEPQTPSVPLDVTYEPYNEEVGFGSLSFIPYEFVDSEDDGNLLLLNTEKLYYNVFVNDELYTFTPDIYSTLTVPLTDIPFSFCDEQDFLNADGQFVILTYTDSISRIGLQAVYTGGGETRKSEIVSVDVTSVNNATAISPVISTTYTDVMGCSLSHPVSHGVFIKTLHYADGNVKCLKLAK